MTDGYGQQPYYGYQAPAYGYPPPPYGYPAQFGSGSFRYGPPGRIRPTGVSILLFVVTLGIYQCFYNYSVHEEMKRHTGRGIGGGVALVLTFLAGVAMPFVTPNEVGNLYLLRSQRRPVSAATGLWATVPLIGGVAVIIGVFVAVFTTAARQSGLDAYGNTTNSFDLSSGQIAALIVLPVLVVAAGLIGQLVYFAKTNGALNDYWASVGVRA